MATVRFVSPESIEFRPTRELVPEEALATLPVAELDTEARTYFEGGDAEPQLFEVRLPPNAHIEPHAHGVDQVMVVVDGEMRFGSQVCRPGAAVYVPGHTLYGFTAGPDGAAFLNFRPTSDRSHFTKDELMAWRASRPG